jgi:hypothetical protein
MFDVENLEHQTIYLKESLALPRIQSVGYFNTAEVRGYGNTHLEDSLHLGKLRPRMFSGEHLNYQTADAPNIGLACVANLLDNFRCHPEDRAL